MIRGGSAIRWFAKSALPRSIPLPSYPNDAEFLYGANPVLCALEARRRSLFGSLLVQSGIDMHESLAERCRELNLSILRVPKFQLDTLSENRPHQGYVLPCSSLRAVEIHASDPGMVDVLQPKNGDHAFVLCLDGIMDPMNLGALLRTAFLTRVSAIVMSGSRTASLTPTVSKASAGALELLVGSVYVVDRMDLAVDHLSCSKFATIGTSVALPSNAKQKNAQQFIDFSDLSRLAESSSRALVLGSEGTGLRTNVLRSCTHLTAIPMRSHPLVDSFNVSVAGGMLMSRLSNLFIDTPASVRQ